MVLEQVSFYVNFSALWVPSCAADINTNPRLEGRHVVSNSQEVVSFLRPETGSRWTHILFVSFASSQMFVFPQSTVSLGVALKGSQIHQGSQFQPLTSCKPKPLSPQMSVKTQSVAGSVVPLKGCLLFLFPAFSCVTQQEVPDIVRTGSPTQYLVDKIVTVCLLVYFLQEYQALGGQGLGLTHLWVKTPAQDLAHSKYSVHFLIPDLHSNTSSVGRLTFSQSSLSFGEGCVTWVTAWLLGDSLPLICVHPSQHSTCLLRFCRAGLRAWMIDHA